MNPDGMHQRSEETRLFIVALIGGQVGAAFGLLFLGGMLFAPLLTALLGSAAGPAFVIGRDRLRAWAGERYVRSELRSGPGRQVTSS